MKAKWQKRGAPAVGEESEVPNAHEALRKQVQEEATQELIQRWTYQLLLVVVSGIAPAKGGLPFDIRDQAMIGDRHAMGVPAQILEHILRSTERRFRID